LHFKPSLSFVPSSERGWSRLLGLAVRCISAADDLASTHHLSEQRMWNLRLTIELRIPASLPIPGGGAVSAYGGMPSLVQITKETNG